METLAPLLGCRRAPDGASAAFAWAGAPPPPSQQQQQQQQSFPLAADASAGGGANSNGSACNSNSGVGLCPVESPLEAWLQQLSHGRWSSSGKPLVFPVDLRHYCGRSSSSATDQASAPTAPQAGDAASSSHGWTCCFASGLQCASCAAADAAAQGTDLDTRLDAAAVALRDVAVRMAVPPSTAADPRLHAVLHVKPAVAATVGGGGGKGAAGGSSADALTTRVSHQQQQQQQGVELLDVRLGEQLAHELCVITRMYHLQLACWYDSGDESGRNNNRAVSGSSGGACGANEQQQQQQRQAEAQRRPRRQGRLQPSAPQGDSHELPAQPQQQQQAVPLVWQGLDAIDTVRLSRLQRRLLPLRGVVERREAALAVSGCSGGHRPCNAALAPTPAWPRCHLEALAHDTLAAVSAELHHRRTLEAQTRATPWLMMSSDHHHHHHQQQQHYDSAEDADDADAEEGNGGRAVGGGGAAAAAAAAGGVSIAGAVDGSSMGGSHEGDALPCAPASFHWDAEALDLLCEAAENMLSQRLATAGMLAGLTGRPAGPCELRAASLELLLAQQQQ